MCIIVDTSVASLVFGSPPYRDYLPLIDWLSKQDKDGILIYGGELGRELVQFERASYFFIQLIRAGRAIKIQDKIVDNEERIVRNLGLCRSNDPHVIALARVSRTRTLCANDHNLWRDFRNRALVPLSNCRIYRNRKHTHLLRHTPGCRGYRRRER